jgi:hypothetical protein
MTDEQVFELIRKYLPKNLAYRQDGGLLDPCKIEGTLGDVLDFVKAIYTEGFKVGYDEGWESANVSTKMNTWSSDDD